ncbi:MAG TPA: iron uptake transporter deferrochelatase/peroxidase subunit [Solirubrobacteraceae bacterium]|nr:iron uptake transporter deferrochelatase/peroxidase subunit [Solirubrobacteraceae bacterium]
MTDGENHRPEGTRKPGITRRGVLSGAALLGIGAGLDHVLDKGSGASTVRPTRARTDSTPVAPAEQLTPFYGPHQGGITTTAQDYLSFAAFDLTSDAVEDLRAVLEQWTAAAASLTVGRPYEPEPQISSKPPLDPGEATDLSPAQLTITVGFGPSLFEGRGLRGRRPAVLSPLPSFTGERLDPASSGGDLCVQACANDPQVAFHAVHLLAKLAGGAATLRWSQIGFARTASTTRVQVTTRNLMGFKDGTDNIRAEEAAAVERFVWVQPGEGPAWMVGGSYLVARRIKILLDGWDAISLDEQQRTIGRDKLTGAPLGLAREYDRVDLQATNPNGELAIPLNAHIRLANPQNNAGQRILRRGYSYAEAAEPGSDELDAGLFFISFQRDPQAQFVPLQARLAASDALNRHTLVTSSSIFACPPGPREGGFIGDALLA